MHTELLKGAYPACVQFRFNTSSNKSDSVRKIWELSLKECKEKMTKALLDDLFVKYSSVKNIIMKDYDKLSKILSPNQIMEIKDSLRKRDQGMAPMLAERSKRQYEPPRPRERKQVVTKRRKPAPKPKKHPKNSNNNQIQQFVTQLRKLLK